MHIQARTGKSETRDAEIRVCARRSGEEVDESRIHQHKTEQSRFDDKVSEDGIETRLKQNREVQSNAKNETKRKM